MESRLEKPVLTARTGPRTAAVSVRVAYWIFTALFCLQIGFTGYAQLRLPQVAQMFTHLGFPAYFRVELSWAKFLGVALLLAPVPSRLKEWAYAGFAITLVSALVAHFAVGDGPEVWAWRRAPSCSGRSLTSSGAVCSPRARALRTAPPARAARRAA